MMKAIRIPVLILALALLGGLNGAAVGRGPQPSGQESSASRVLGGEPEPRLGQRDPTLGEAEIRIDPYEGYYLYLYDDGGDYPSLANPGWHEEAQGITHDHSNWFITQKLALWKIAMHLDLAAPGTPNVTPGLYRINVGDEPELANEGYNHFGDLDYYEFDGQGYLVAALEIWPAEDIRPAIAVFRTDTLDLVDHVRLWKQHNGPWVAVNPQTGVVHTSNGDNVTSINRWSMNWAELKRTGTLQPLQELAPLELYNEQGQPLTLNSIQGGVISPNGELLYLVGNDKDDSDAHGIQVFELSTGRRVMHSTNGYGHFNCHFDAGGWPDDMEEPEGITIWDLDNAGAPGISGQLHVIMLDNDWPSADEVTIEHYTNTILVNGSYPGPGHPNKNGTPSYPFRTVAAAYNLAWDRAQIKIEAGNYPESATFSKRIRLLAEGGTATIGTGE